MTREKIIRLSMLQREMLDKAEREKAEKERQNKELLGKVDELLASQARTQTAFNEMAVAMAEQVAENKRLNGIIADLTEQLKLTNKERFGSKSQRGGPNPSRNLRPLTNERKNSLFFGSHKMARASAIFHTVIATCRMKSLSLMDFLKTFFRKIVEGVDDYSLLMLHTIGIPIN